MKYCIGGGEGPISSVSTARPWKQGCICEACASGCPVAKRKICCASNLFWIRTTVFLSSLFRRVLAYLLEQPRLGIVRPLCNGFLRVLFFLFLLFFFSQPPGSQPSLSPLQKADRGSAVVVRSRSRVFLYTVANHVRP